MFRVACRKVVWEDRTVFQLETTLAIANKAEKQQ